MKKKMASACAVILASAALAGVAGCPGLMDEKSRLTVNRAVWAAAEIADYEYQFQQLCFCPEDVTRKVVITVEGGAIIGVRDAENGEPVEEPSEDFYPTIDELFERIEEAIDEQAHSVVVDYDDQLGIPVSVEIDFIANAVDEEISYSAEEFAEL